MSLEPGGSANPPTRSHVKKHEWAQKLFFKTQFQFWLEGTGAEEDSLTFLTRKKLPSQVPSIRIRIPPPSGRRGQCRRRRAEPLVPGPGRRPRKVCPGGRRAPGSGPRPARRRGTALTSPSGSGGGQAGAGAAQSRERGRRPAGMDGWGSNRAQEGTFHTGSSRSP